MSTVVDFGFCGVSATARRFSSDQLCSASRRTLRACTTPSSVLTRCSSMRSRLPSHTAVFHLSASFCADSQILYPWKVTKHRFTEFQQLSTIRTAHGSIERGLHIVSREARTEPNCMSDNPFHHCTASGRSALRAVLKCCQHRAHSSL